MTSVEIPEISQTMFNALTDDVYVVFITYHNTIDKTLSEALSLLKIDYGQSYKFVLEDIENYTKIKGGEITDFRIITIKGNLK